MSSGPSYERIAQAAILLRNKGFDDVAKFLLAREKQAKRKSNKGKRRVLLASHMRGKGGVVYIAADLLEGIEIDKP